MLHEGVDIEAGAWRVSSIFTQGEERACTKFWRGEVRSNWEDFKQLCLAGLQYPMKGSSGCCCLISSGGQIVENLKSEPGTWEFINKSVGAL